jgi:hypothetical protein
MSKWLLPWAWGTSLAATSHSSSLILMQPKVREDSTAVGFVVVVVVVVVVVAVCTFVHLNAYVSISNSL